MSIAAAIQQGDQALEIVALARVTTGITPVSGPRRQNHKDLVLWQKAMGLACAVHFVTKQMPRAEIFALTSQMRRAAVSVPSNTAEGAARRTTREFLAFLHIARGSLAELETQLMLSRQIGYLAYDAVAPVLAQADEVGRLLNAVISGLNRRQNQGSSLPPDH